jgi:hypothetical protein
VTGPSQTILDTNVVVSVTDKHIMQNKQSHDQNRNAAKEIPGMFGKKIKVPNKPANHDEQ